MELINDWNIMIEINGKIISTIMYLCVNVYTYTYKHIQLYVYILKLYII